MNITGIIPQQEVNYSTQKTDMEKAVAAFQDLYPDAEITSIDGRDVVDICESCGLPILEGQAYQYDADGIHWHVEC